MKLRRTPRNGLGITHWNEQDDPSHQLSGLENEVSGLMFVGYWRGPSAEVMDKVITCWPTESASFIGYRCPGTMAGEIDDHTYVYVRVIQFPDDTWLDVVRKSLQAFIDSGAKIAWCGGTECIMNYTRETGFQGCYAVLTPKHDFYCLGGLDDPISFIGDDIELVGRIRESVRREELEEDEAGGG
jgi:hypothetical protein